MTEATNELVTVRPARATLQGLFKVGPTNASTSDMVYQEWRITPSIAMAMLEANTENRPLDQSNVNWLAGLIERGEWRVTHQGIAVAADHTLLDGQHRLWAIIQTGVPVNVMVATNVDKDVFAALDLGKRRTNSDILGFNQRDLEVTARICSLCGRGGRLSPTQISTVHQVFGETVADLRNYAPSRRHGIGGATPRAIVVVRAMTGLRDYAFETFRNLTLLNYSAMPPIAQSFMKQQDSGKTSSSDRNDLAARMWYVTDPKRAKVTRLQVVSSSDVVAEWREQARRLAGSALP